MPNTAHLNSTIEALSKGLAQAKGGASRSITSWADTLKGDAKLAGIADELHKLHDLLSSDQIDSASLKKSLSTLGQHTTKAAAAAEGATADKIKELGQLLTTAADQLK
ncbi:hypothetical protein [uncultured Hymenobacter sp.]|uniref:hypothetical protein n=1 Tax=uncultured Hymenobacter sp. TaxID=170016 RepID=UPI0035C94724